MNKSELGRLLADNLKHLNAKERDHLMRFAYLGETGSYTSSETFLSDSFLDSLKDALKIPKENATRCLFAGMDYHIDWLFAAMFMTAQGASISKPDKNSDPFDMDAPPQNNEPDLRPILGNQEDVDLLVLLDDGDHLHLTFIEAKGMDGFGREQLGRKIIRVYNCITRAGSNDGSRAWPRSLKFTYLLASARRDPPIAGTLHSHIIESESPSTPIIKIKELIDCIKDGHTDEATLKTPEHYLEIKNFPENLWRVQRLNKKGNMKSQKRNFTHWKLAYRQARNSAPSKA